MRNLVLHFRERLNLLWQAGSSRRFAKLGGVLAAAFVLIAGTSLVFGSRGDNRANASQLSGARGSESRANLPFEFQFIGQGRITGGSDDKWMIGNVAIQVDKHSQLNSELHPGDFVSLSGRILNKEGWLADQIELTPEGQSFFTFNGPLEWVRGAAWRIGGHDLLTNGQTRIGNNLMPNDLLLATFTVLDTGDWMAMEIKAFERFPLEPAPAATAAPTQTPEPTEAPTETEVAPPNPIPVYKPYEGEGKDKPPNSQKNSRPKGKSKGKGNR